MEHNFNISMLIGIYDFNNCLKECVSRLKMYIPLYLLINFWVPFLSTFWVRIAYLYGYAVQWLVSYRYKIVPMEELHIILHHFVNCHASSALEHSHTYQDQQTKNCHFPKQKCPWNKISKYRKMEKWATFLTLVPQMFLRWIINA